MDTNNRSKMMKLYKMIRVGAKTEASEARADAIYSALDAIGQREITKWHKARGK